MVSSTFGTFLETTKSLNQATQGPTTIDASTVASAIADKTVPVNELASRLYVKPTDLMNTVVQLKQSGLLDIDTVDGQSAVRLTPLGRGFLE